MLLFTMHVHQRIEQIVNDTKYTTVLVVAIWSWSW